MGLAERSDYTYGEERRRRRGDSCLRFLLELWKPEGAQHDLVHRCTGIHPAHCHDCSLDRQCGTAKEEGLEISENFGFTIEWPVKS
jgi:hypothetical protein